MVGVVGLSWLESFGMPGYEACLYGDVEVLLWHGSGACGLGIVCQVTRVHAGATMYFV